ncbi:MAG: hypothetical protein K0R97_391 [Oerskovia sp.]|jgi:hypothetical protein|nr:hypothetical protein [Oerskovia sp.]
MSTAVVGADVGALRALGEGFASSATELGSIADRLSAELSAASWQGRDGDQFRDSWTGRIRPLLAGVATSLDEQARALRANADAQEATSAGEGGPAGGAGPGAVPPGAVDAGVPGSASSDGAPPAWLVPDSDLTANMTLGGVYNWAAAGAVDAWSAFNKVDDPLGVGSLTSHLGTAGKVLGATGFVFDGYSVYSGGVQAWEGFAEGDGYKGTDGLITAGLGAAGIGAAIFLASNPVGWAIAGAGAVWGVATLLSGDVPVTQRISDVAVGAWNGASDVAGDVWEAGGDFVDGATETLKKLWPW